MQTKMTTSMQASLGDRLADLNRRIEGLQSHRDGEDSPDATALLFQLSRERDQISDALEQATLIDNAVFDKHAIEIGDTVTIRDANGETERYVLVDRQVGTRVCSDWVSAVSPLGAALIGRSKGDVVQVETPGGRESFVILDFERCGQVGDDPIPAA